MLECMRNDCDRPATEKTPGGGDLCSKHADAFWAQREKTNRDYPDSDIAPAWFDPTYAGERWEEDE